MKQKQKAILHSKRFKVNFIEADMPIYDSDFTTAMHYNNTIKRQETNERHQVIKLSTYKKVKSE